MIKPWLLDSGPLGRLAHPNPNQEVSLWLEAELGRGVPIMIPEITDYEVRRSLLLERLTRSVARLDELKAVLIYLPINTAVMVNASELWAAARQRGLPTSDPHSLDIDVILAAQALQVGGRIATENVRHLSLVSRMLRTGGPREQTSDTQRIVSCEFLPFHVHCR